MTRKNIDQEKGLIWKNRDIVYVVSYLNKKMSKTDKVVTVFNNVQEAKRYYQFCISRYSCVQMDTCRVYDGYKVEKMSEMEDKNCFGKSGG